MARKKIALVGGGQIGGILALLAAAVLVEARGADFSEGDELSRPIPKDS